MKKTLWSKLLLAKRSDLKAFETFLGKYRPVLSAYLTNHGREAAAADELIKIATSNKILVRADTAKAYFRCLLLALAKEFARYPTVADATPFLDRKLEYDPEFDPLWLSNIVGNCLDSLEQKCAKEKTTYAQVLRMFVEGAEDRDIAQRLSKSLADVRREMHVAKKALGGYMRSVIRHYCSSEQEFHDEVGYVQKFLPTRGFHPTAGLRIEGDGEVTADPLG